MTEKSKIGKEVATLSLLRADQCDYQINDQALAYMAQQQLPKAPLERLRHHGGELFADEGHWEAHLKRLGITPARHWRIATEIERASRRYG